MELKFSKLEFQVVKNIYPDGTKFKFQYFFKMEIECSKLES